MDVEAFLFGGIGRRKGSCRLVEEIGGDHCDHCKCTSVGVNLTQLSVDFTCAQYPTATLALACRFRGVSISLPLRHFLACHPLLLLLSSCSLESYTYLASLQSTGKRSALGAVHKAELYGGVLSSSLTAEFLRGNEYVLDPHGISHF